MANDQLLDRPPRIQPQLPIATIEVPAPPKKESQQTQSLIETMLPLVSIMGYLLISLTGRASNILFVLPMALTMVISVSSSLFRNRRARLEVERKAEAYAQRLSGLRNDMRSYHQLQRDFYFYNYPDTQTMLNIAKAEQTSRSGPRIWERRATDGDFGALTLGVAARPSTVIYKMASADNEEDPQMDDAIRLCEDSRSVADVPVLLDMFDLNGGANADAAAGVRSTVGIYEINAEANRDYVYRYIQSLLIGFATFHSYADASLRVIASKQAKAEQRWGWAEKLPHTRNGKQSLICYEGDFVQGRNNKSVDRLPLYWRDLRNELLVRQQRLRERGVTEFRLPFLLVIVDMLGAEPESLLANAEREQAIGMIMREGLHLGAAVIFLAGTPNKIPSDCKAVVELETAGDRLIFRYAETDINTPQFVGTVEMPRGINLEGFAANLSQYEIRLSAASSLATSLDLLQLHASASVNDLKTLENWRRSRISAEWPRVEIGLRGNNEKTELIFSADASGVHGMIAGTTGSGKSELLLTLITGLAINYDPSIVNFVLVDFKGGSAFNEFRHLPHCVDIVTNLTESAVERMFSAIKAELDRRGALIADSKVKHIIEYRERRYHLDARPNHTTKFVYPQPFPNLFIIIDEFAEMVAHNNEFKAQLDSITRLGRAIGVSLILATQRPAGAITDQMRANMKFRVCLRVETPEDSRELLGRSDAAYLPPGVPGRGYLQIGNDQPDLVQVARAGGPYRAAAGQAAEMPAVIFPTRQKNKERDEPLSKVIVDQMAIFARDAANGVARQRKPWPNALPIYLPLDMPITTEYLPADDFKLLENGQQPVQPLNSLVEEGWLSPGGSEWHGALPWSSPLVLSTNIGLVDQPRRARQLILNIDLKDGHMVLFGASGMGKTTFLRTLVAGLAVRHTPDMLHMYILDFGGRGLSVFESLPHVGQIIPPDERERFTRLLRRLNDTIAERKNQFSQFSVDSLVAFNQKYPDKTMPAILVIIDNFAEIKENFEEALTVFQYLLREGRNAGVYFVATGDLPNAMTGKIITQFGRRFTLRLSDSSEYSTIVGSGAPSLDEIYGRGVMAVERSVSRTPLEFQLASPVGLPPDQIVYIEDDTVRAVNELESVDKLASEIAPQMEALSKKMKAAWERRYAGMRDRGPQPIGVLPTLIDWFTLPQRDDKLPNVHAVVGISDRHLTPQAINLDKDGPHFLLVGPPLSGKTTLLQTWMLTLARAYSPQEVSFIMVDPQDRLANSVDKTLPHVLMNVVEKEDFQRMAQVLRFEYEAPQAEAPQADQPQSDQPTKRPQIFVFIDSYDDIAELASTKDLESLGRLANLYSREGLRFILCGSEDIFRLNDELRRRAWRARYGFALQTDKAIEALGGRLPATLKNTELAPGRGFLVKSGRPVLTQVAAIFSDDPDRDDAVREDFYQQVRTRHEDQRYSLRYDLATPEQRDKFFKSADAAASAPAAPQASPSATLSAAVSAPDIAQHPHYAFFAEHLLRLPGELIGRMGVKSAVSHIKLDELSNKSPEWVKLALQNGEITLPAEVDPALFQEAEHLLVQQSLLTPQNLILLPPSLVQRLGVKLPQDMWEKFTKGDLAPDRLDRKIKDGTVALPKALPSEVAAEARHLLAYYALLSGANLKRLPLDVIERIGLTLEGAKVETGKAEEKLDADGKPAGRGPTPTREMTLPDLLSEQVKAEHIDRDQRTRKIRLPEIVDEALMAEIEQHLQVAPSD